MTAGMKRALKWIAGLLAAVVVIFFAGAYLLPGEAVVQRQIQIAAPPAKVYAVMASIKRFNEFSPWAEMDPAMKFAFEGPDSGSGQKMSWQSDRIGNGWMTIVETVPDRRVASILDFGMGTATASFELAPADKVTAVTWGFKQELSYPLARWIGPMMDKWVGGDFERGLAKLKTVAEKATAAQ
jgi:Polyketide cyclase / dehydrase and lipid transport